MFLVKMQLLQGKNEFRIPGQKAVVSSGVCLYNVNGKIDFCRSMMNDEKQDK